MLEAFGEYGNRFADKYYDQLGEYAGVGAVVMGLLAELLKCECGGMRHPVTVIDKWEKKHEYYHCRRCNGWWRFNSEVSEEKRAYQVELFPTERREG